MRKHNVSKYVSALKRLDVALKIAVTLVGPLLAFIYVFNDTMKV